MGSDMFGFTSRQEASVQETKRLPLYIPQVQSFSHIEARGDLNKSQPILTDIYKNSTEWLVYKK